VAAVLVLCAVAVVAGIRSIRAIAEHVGDTRAPGVDAVPALPGVRPTPAVESRRSGGRSPALTRSRWTSRSAPGWAAAILTMRAPTWPTTRDRDAAADQRRRQDRARSPHRRRHGPDLWPPPSQGWYWPGRRSGCRAMRSPIRAAAGPDRHRRHVVVAMPHTHATRLHCTAHRLRVHRERAISRTCTRPWMD